MSARRCLWARRGDRRLEGTLTRPRARPAATLRVSALGSLGLAPLPALTDCYRRIFLLAAHPGEGLLSTRLTRSSPGAVSAANPTGAAVRICPTSLPLGTLNHLC